MTVRWRDLLDHLHVPWSDHGHNVRRGEIVIRCCWCGDDPSMHLGINEASGFYNCLRSQQHRGRRPYYLLRALGVNPKEMDDLINAFGGTANGPPPPRPARYEQSEVAQRWRFFEPADTAALDYLSRRGFTDPTRTAKDFDLRTGRGKWARRIWFKLTDLDHQIIGFTGRAIDNWREPRYYAEAAETGLYWPRYPADHHNLAILVEGPIDALRIADATRRRRNLFVAALNGLSVGGNKRMQLSHIAQTTPRFAVALDRAVSASQAQRLIDELRMIPALGKITRLAMPAMVDDPGTMSNLGVEQWLATI